MDETMRNRFSGWAGRKKLHLQTLSGEILNLRWSIVHYLTTKSGLKDEITINGSLVIGLLLSLDLWIEDLLLLG